METKVVNPKTYFYKEGTTTLNKIHEYADTVVPEVIQEMQKAGIEEAGPMEFLYYGATNDMDKEFTLRIAVPVKEEKPCSDGFHFKKTNDFKCVSSEYKGDVSKMFPVYEQMYQHLATKQLQPNDEIREVYIQWENPASDKNIKPWKQK